MDREKIDKLFEKLQKETEELKSLKDELTKQKVQAEGLVLNKEKSELKITTPLGNLELRWHSHSDGSQALGIDIYGRGCSEIRSDCYTGVNFVSLRCNPEFEKKDC